MAYLKFYVGALGDFLDSIELYLPMFGSFILLGVFYLSVGIVSLSLIKTSLPRRAILIAIYIAVFYPTSYFINLGFTMTNSNYFKITDSGGSNIDVIKFSLIDYDYEDDLKEALSRLLPINSSREEVERVLFSSAEVGFSSNRGLDNTLNITDDGYLVIYGALDRRLLKTIWVKYNNMDSLINIDVKYMRGKEAHPYIFMLSLLDKKER